MRTFSIAAALVGLLILVAVGSAGGDWGGGGTDRNVPPLLVNAVYTLTILFLVAMAGLAVWALTGPSGGTRVERPRGHGWVGLAFFALVLLSWNAFANRNPLENSGPEEAEPIGVPQTLPESPDGFAAAPGPQFQWWIAAGAVAALVAVFLYERRRRAREPERSAVRELEEVLSQTLVELEGELDTDPRRAVIQAYARMERVLAAHGHGRRPAEAPLEYLARILTELDVRPQAAHALTELFERAKFSRHEIDVAMRAEAVASLEAVRDDLRAAA